MKSNGEGKPVVSLDIDGTLGDYHYNFLDFASRYFGSFYSDRLAGANNPGLPLWEWMGISRRDYRDAKLAYRQGGWKRWMPVYLGARELTRAIRAAGAEVWLCTTRPYLRLDNVDPDTREWLSRNNIEYDALLFDPVHEGTKYDELARQAGPRVAAIFDDLPEMIVAAEKALPKVDTILRDQPYNRHIRHPRRVKSSIEARELILADIKLWKEWNS